MDISIVIMGLVMLALIILPFVLISMKNNKKSK